MITPSDFSHPNTAKIIELEKEYAKGITEGKPFEELNKIRNKINALKSEINAGRGNGDKIN